MRSGIGYREFAEVSKTAFVNVAAEDYGLRGRPTNSSRVAVITGISRKEVARIRARGPGISEENIPVAPAAEVLHKWNTDAAYLDNDAEPRPLAFDDKAVSFASLVATSVGDIPHGAMKTELLRVGAIEELPSGEVRIVKRHFVPRRSDDKLQHGLEVAIRRLAETIAFNADPKREAKTRFERVVSSVSIKEDSFGELTDATSEMLQRFSEDYDDLLSKYENKNNKASHSPEIGIGLYFFSSEGTE